MTQTFYKIITQEQNITMPLKISICGLVSQTFLLMVHCKIIFYKCREKTFSLIVCDNLKLHCVLFQTIWYNFFYIKQYNKSMSFQTMSFGYFFIVIRSIYKNQGKIKQNNFVHNRCKNPYENVQIIDFQYFSVYSKHICQLLHQNRRVQIFCNMG